MARADFELRSRFKHGCRRVSTPFDTAAKSTPVTIVTAGQLPIVGPGDALIRLAPASGHQHGADVACPTCSGHQEVRAQLFELMESVRRGLRPSFSRVIVDATAMSDPQSAIDAVAGKLAATALRDHVVARNFHLVG